MEPTVLNFIIVGVGAYLIGSISPALILSNHFVKKDIRKYGSGNAGATNMARSFGWKLGLLTFLLDILKGALVAYFAGFFLGQLGTMVGAICVVLGHNFPIYYGFKGGKGASTTLGAVLVLDAVPVLIILVVVFLLIFFTKYVSLGSIVGFVIMAVAIVIHNAGEIYIQIAAVALAALGILAHRENIARLLKGTENKFSFKRSKARSKAKK